MDEDNLKSWATQPDVCRCCLSTSGMWDLTCSYITEAGVKEVYSDMLQDCFGVTLSSLSDWGPSRLVCSMCVGHLKDANAFKKKVLQAEQYFVNYHNNKKDLEDTRKTEDVTYALSPECNLNEDVDTKNTDFDTEFIKTEEKEDDLKPIAKPDTIKHTRKRQKVKTQRKKTKDGSDSDTPISELKTFAIRNKAEKCVEVSKENEACANNATADAASSKRPKSRKITKMSADSYVNNRHLRSNITLLLKYSTIIPFRYIKNNKYRCLYCDLEFILFKQMKEHVTTQHNNIDDNSIFKCLNTPRDLIKADVSEIKCKICNENLKNLDNLVTHLTSIHDEVYFSSRAKPDHGILGFDLSSDRFRCSICNSEFAFFKSLSGHMNEHSSEYVCHVCGKNFVSDHRLQTHVIRHRQNLVDVNCKICGAEFRTVSAKNHHTRIEHSKKFKCPECFADFDQYQHRLKHMIDSHGFKKPEFKCAVCKKALASSSGLRAHMRYTHFRRVEFPCELCGKIFFYKWIWERHMDVHNGVKNYECKFCNKKFAKPYTLKVHVRTHTNEKRFACSLCPSAFIQKCSLKNHVKVHHPGSATEPSPSQ